LGTSSEQIRGFGDPRGIRTPVLLAENQASSTARPWGHLTLV
jgi:hypothetical protein